MSTVKRDIGKGGAYQMDLYEIFNSIVTDLNNVKTQLAALGAKLDADAGVTDTNYVSGGTCITTVTTVMGVMGAENGIVE